MIDGIVHDKSNGNRFKISRGGAHELVSGLSPHFTLPFASNQMAEAAVK